MRTAVLVCLMAGAFSALPLRVIAPQRQAIEPLVGTLNVDLPDPKNVSFFYGPRHPFAGWFFINGELRGKLPLRRRLMLQPGVYELRVVLAAHTGNDESNFLTIRWPRITVSQGGTHEFRPIDDFRFFPSSARADNEKYAESYVPSLDHRLFASSAENLTYLEMQAWEDIEQSWKNYLEGSVFAKVLAAAEQIARAPPSRPVVWIDVPADYGGAREFDVEQIRLLQTAVTPNIRGWGDRIADLRNPLPAEAEREFLRAMEALRQRNQHYIAFVAQQFDFIVAALERARARRP